MQDDDSMLLFYMRKADQTYERVNEGIQCPNANPQQSFILHKAADVRSAMFSIRTAAFACLIHMMCGGEEVEG